MRTFIAIRIPTEVKEALRAVQESLDRGFKSVGWVRPEAVHLTLKFLGEVDDKRLEELGSALQEAASGIPPFSLTVEGVGGFPNQKSPRVIWAGIKENESFAKLQRQVEEHLNAIGFEREERPFTPHLTLCRIKSIGDGKALGRLLADIKPQIKADFRVSSVILFKSELKKTGAEYTAMKEAALKP
ncbi:MAG: 2'-5' RNA ligase [Deltaproteobacteria bacterium GWC2_55_46]|nr:MAG: 2'-5' RNA ligase [Deltaproteobacteria bacterium GWA2_55_82]OGQ62195.1 MAG: 2'-5' RNA ligase [Deltaproteobacteria bacterium RIFCSPLOWO2_02_FULL_55_12]OIJ73236.1 MAG: 2'-5' RNA ligase [Deltaproteobacteria bacterium GWC2_55_46]